MSQSDDQEVVELLAANWVTRNQFVQVANRLQRADNESKCDKIRQEATETFKDILSVIDPQAEIEVEGPSCLITFADGSTLSISIEEEICETCHQKPGKPRVDNGLKAGIHCDDCWKSLVAACRKRSY